MKFSPSEVTQAAEATGFRAEMVEKVLLLLDLLNALNSHPFLKGKWVLKGGSALNMFMLDLLRLSVDIDLKYVGALDREVMLEERPKIEQAAQAVFSREGFATRRIPGEHAALLARGQARDLFDCHRILAIDNLERDRLRIAFVIYGGMNRKDWRSVSIEDVDFDAAELTRLLVPTLFVHETKKNVSPTEYGERLVKGCRDGLSMVLPFTDSELKFLDLLLDQGVIDPTFLTEDKALQLRMQNQPLLEWKAINVRRHKKLS